jgi:hypothetical protein
MQAGGEQEMALEERAAFPEEMQQVLVHGLHLTAGAGTRLPAYPAYTAAMSRAAEVPT